MTAAKLVYATNAYSHLFGELGRLQAPAFTYMIATQPPTDEQLGSGTAYLALAAGHRSDITVLSRVPVLDPAITIVGVPAAAALAGRVLAGHRPPSVARQPLD